MDIRAYCPLSLRRQVIQYFGVGGAERYQPYRQPNKNEVDKKEGVWGIFINHALQILGKEGNALFSIAIFFEWLEKHLSQAALFCNTGHFCKNENRNSEVQQCLFMRKEPNVPSE